MIVLVAKIFDPGDPAFQVRELESREDPTERVERELALVRAELEQVASELEASKHSRHQLEDELAKQVSLLFGCWKPP